MTSKISKSPVLTNYGDASRVSHKRSEKDNCPDICLIEKVHSNYNSKDHGATMEIEDEEVVRTFGNSPKMKRLHMENIGQRNKNVKSPLCNEGADADAPCNGFVTARAKLVLI